MWSRWPGGRAIVASAGVRSSYRRPWLDYCDDRNMVAQSLLRVVRERADFDIQYLPSIRDEHEIHVVGTFASPLEVGRVVLLIAGVLDAAKGVVRAD